jgi:hypothetical protein
MSSFRLEQVEVAEPCRASWNQMRGDEIRRFCQGCQKHVHNLSAMSQSEAEQLVCRTRGELCVRFVRQTSGALATLDYRTGSGRRAWSWRAWSAIGLAGALVAGLVNAALFGDRVMPRTGVVMGAMIAPPRVAPLPPTTSLPRADALNDPAAEQ